MDFKVYMLATVDTTGRNKGNSTGDKDAGMQVSWREARPAHSRTEGACSMRVGGGAEATGSIPQRYRRG